MRVLVIFLFLLPSSVFGQVLMVDSVPFYPNIQSAAQGKVICQNGDPRYMTLHVNKVDYIFKKGLPDAVYTAFYDENYQDSALTVTMQGGYMNGVMIRWDERFNIYTEVTQYEFGRIDGYCIQYLIEPDTTIYTNIYYYEKGLPVDAIKIEW